MTYGGKTFQELIEAEHQIAMVMDLNKCLGCQTCSVACKTLWTGDEGMTAMYWNHVDTMPGPGYPKNWQELGGGSKDGVFQKGELPPSEDYGGDWDFNHEDVLLNPEWNDRKLEPKNAKWGPNWAEDQGEGDYPNQYYFYLPRLCNHCTNPACVAACPRHALYKREEDGIVLLDQERCNGYRFCIEACPYKKIYFNAVLEKSQKCIFCYPRVEQGEAPACAKQCPGRLRYVGFLDDTEGPIFKLVKKYKVALPLLPDRETEPNVFYLPPLAPPVFDEEGNLVDDGERIPRDYLKELFGDGVDHSIETLRREMTLKKAGQDSELMDILIAYKFEKNFKLDRESALLPVIQP